MCCCVIGLGYIGLPTALMLAKNGQNVIGTDYNQDLVRTLNNNKITFEEEGLTELFEDAVENGIKFSTEYQSVNDYIIAVPTPYYDDTKKIDPRYLISAIEEVLKGRNNRLLKEIQRRDTRERVPAQGKLGV